MTQHVVCFTHDQAMTHDQCHVKHVKVVTPGPAAITLSSADGAGEHDPSTPTWWRGQLSLQVAELSSDTLCKRMVFRRPGYLGVTKLFHNLGNDKEQAPPAVAEHAWQTWQQPCP